jgi:tellurite resistance protein TerC
MIWLYLGFVLFVLVLLALDLGVFHKKSHVIGMKEALGWSAFWIALGLSFGVLIYFAYGGNWFGLGGRVDPVTGAVLDGPTAAVKYLTGYVVEKSLSVDNIFVIAMLFSFFAIPAQYQHRVLFYGILGALLMRGVMIGIGAALISAASWVIYVFAAILILTAIKMLVLKEGHKDPSQNVVVKWVKRLFPVTDKLHGEHFSVVAGSAASHEPAIAGGAEEEDKAVASAKPGTWMLTPLALVLILVEVTDLIFAVDSIPAIFAITGDAFIVFTSNVFAILGLRSLYFALAGMMRSFKYLKPALAVVLLVVGGKMLMHTQLKAWLGEQFNLYLLGVILLILTVGVVASLLSRGKDDDAKGEAVVHAA